MATILSAADVAVGTVLPPQTFRLTRLDGVRYAGASGDLNVIHWNERVATAVGLPGVVAHGMLTMGRALRVVTDWIGDPAAVEEYAVRFTRPIVIPDDADGADLEVTGVVAEILDDQRVRIDLTVRSGGQTVLARPRAIVRLG
ncbi:MAG: dehydratase [Actinomycetota bacterium]|nr:MAG: dehydratase [Actinomycetota bacterium]